MVGLATAVATAAVKGPGGGLGGRLSRGRRCDRCGALEMVAWGSTTSASASTGVESSSVMRRAWISSASVMTRGAEPSRAPPVLAAALRLAASARGHLPIDEPTRTRCRPPGAEPSVHVTPSPRARADRPVAEATSTARPSRRSPRGSASPVLRRREVVGRRGRRSRTAHLPRCRPHRAARTPPGRHRQGRSSRAATRRRPGGDGMFQPGARDPDSGQNGRLTRPTNQR